MVPGTAAGVSRTLKWPALLLAAVAVLGAGWADDWQSVTAAASGVTSIQADFTQEKRMRILARPLTSRGRFVFEKPGSLRWEYTSPVRSLLLTAEGRTRRFAESEGRLVEAAEAPFEVMPMVMKEITRWLGGRFSESTDFEATLVPGQKIVLAPRNEALSRWVQRIELAFADTPGVIRTVTIVESPESSTIMTFSEPRINQPVAGRLFREP